MLGNNSQRLSIWLKLENKFDYTSFNDMCISEKTDTLPILEFAQKVGMLEVSKNMFPELSYSEAYLKLLSDFQFVPTPMLNPVLSSTKIDIVGGCGSCGGGSIR